MFNFGVIGTGPWGRNDVRNPPGSYQECVQLLDCCYPKT